MGERFEEKQAEVGGDAGLAELKLALSCRPHDCRPGYLFTLRVTNIGDDPVCVRFPTSQQFDIIVQSAEGAPLWSWSADRAFLQMVSDRELLPGESAVYEVYWDGRLTDGSRFAGGRYRATAHFLGQTVGHVPPATVELVVGDRQFAAGEQLL